MRERVLTQRELNRALLARQLLLERGRMSIPKALVRLEPFDGIPRTQRRADDEAARLAAFHR